MHLKTTSETTASTIIPILQHKNEGTGAAIPVPLKSMAMLVLSEMELGFFTDI